MFLYTVANHLQVYIVPQPMKTSNLSSIIFAELPVSFVIKMMGKNQELYFGGELHNLFCDNLPCSNPPLH
jgi:hypothetical protein